MFHPSSPILLADDDRKYREASIGASRFLGLPREKIIGSSWDDLAVPAIRPVISERWLSFLNEGYQEGTFQIEAPGGGVREVEYSAKLNVLPVRHLVVFRDKQPDSGKSPAQTPTPSWVQDYALFLLDMDGNIVAWYAGAERIYGYKSPDVIGQHVSFLYPGDHSPEVMHPAANSAFVRAEANVQKAASEGHSGNEGWQLRKDGTRFWANAITMALKDENGDLQGFARVVRDFTDRHARDEKLRLGRSKIRPIQTESTIAGVVSGEFDRITEMNDRFLEIVGYSREDLVEGRFGWPDLTPPEYVAMDELAHEESLRFGACTPFEKQLIRRDGTRVPVLVATAVLRLSPFQWITFVTDLRARDRQESVDVPLKAELHQFTEIVGSSAPMMRALAQAELVAPTDATVLILGETGTGKELVARAIHQLSPRRNLPFISLNCAAIPTGLFESELFGHERGAFTGAVSQKMGRFEMANRGTLFLDEVGDIPLELQPKLLRALQEKCFERLGGTRTIPIDVRLVAATNRNLEKMMGDNLFRSDLYYRLKVFPINTPRLRDHAEDIPALVRHFTKIYAAKTKRNIDRISAATMKALVQWTWPGNVRELENFIERSVILSQGRSLAAPLAELRSDAEDSNGYSTLEEMERDHILRVFRETSGVVSMAAQRLGIPRTSLHGRMKSLGISRRDLLGMLP